MNTLTCPRCRGMMQTFQRVGVTIDQCTNCRGIFLDHGELEQILNAEKNWVAQQQPYPQQGYPQQGPPPGYAPPAPAPGYVAPVPAPGMHPQGGHGYYGHAKHGQHGGYYGHRRGGHGGHGYYGHGRHGYGHRKSFIQQLFD
ncbi:MAG: zf-TFIIB domain-containing protein [Streptomycetaceae bacterium]|nr:zf-TFIIB domain-containing protein [Streptomycetaceae bacterium]